MTPPARLQAAIELLDLIIVSSRENGPAADTIIAKWFATRRYAGSKDRRAVRELVYRAVRAFGKAPVGGRAAFARLAQSDLELAALFDGSPYGPAGLTKNEPLAYQGIMPEWLGTLIDKSEHAALLDRAPLDLRVNRLKTTREALLAAWPDAKSIPIATDGLRFDNAFAVEASDAFRDGQVEVQDAGSQLIAEACRAIPGMIVVDLCAGGGGKALALAAAMGGPNQGSGQLIACDTDRTRLQRLPQRAERAGATVETRLLDPMQENEVLGDLAGQADVVLVDAPCSGSGTLRRNPEARWRLTTDRLKRVVALQAHVLDVAAVLTRPGGVLVYAVCSLIAREGADQVAAFLSRYPGWRAETPFEAGRADGPGRRLTPAHDGTDGFFVARLISPC